MTLKTYGDWFTGFGGMTLGASDARLTVVFGAEYDPKIAEVYRLNIGDHIRVCNLLEVDVSEFPRVDVFHASPPCPNFSNAKTNGKETENDIALSAKVAEYIAYHLPDAFTLENVYKYRQSKSWQVIAQTLLTHGYLFNYWHVNMADYGVPQTRQRMIVIARRDGVMPQLPPATHAESPQVGLFGTMKRWVSWYEAIEDLIPDFPSWQPTKRVTDSYPEEMPKLALVNTKDTNFTSRPTTVFDKSLPAFSITSSHVPSCVAVYKNGYHFSVTSSALSRFQSFPRWYRLPDSRSLSCHGTGNAVPPLFAEKLYTHLLQQYSG